MQTIGTSKILYSIRITLCLLLTMLSSCAGMGGPLGWTGATPEQIKALSSIKDAGATCVRGVYAGAIITITSANIDKGIPAGLTIKEDCSMTFDVKTPTAGPK